MARDVMDESKRRELIEKELESDEEEIEEETPAEDIEPEEEPIEAVEEDAEIVEEPEAQEAEAQEVEPEEVVEPEPATPEIQPPSSMTENDREAFRDLPPSAKAFIVRREAERDRALNHKFSELAQTRRQYAEIEQAIRPHANRLSRSGRPVGQVIDNVLAWEEYYEKDPANALLEHAGSLGLNIADLANMQQQGGGYIQPNPEFQELSQKLEKLETSLGGIEEQKQEQLTQYIRSEASAFIQNTDTNGHLQDPSTYQEWANLAEAYQQMTPEASLRDVYQKAYDSVVWGNAERREQIQQAQAEKEKQARIKEEKAKASKAHRAGSSIKGGSPNGTTTEKPTDRRELIEAVIGGEL